ncbi:MAG: LssY C-terminal domain-containing protein [Acidobacteriota bacterium]|nr:LssY C-terminal domain-containing protein [Acidobacteriota bacterium]
MMRARLRVDPLKCGSKPGADFQSQSERREPARRIVAVAALLPILAFAACGTPVQTTAGQSAAVQASSNAQAPLTLPSGTILYVRLDTAVSTASSKAGSPVKAHVVRQAFVGNSVAVPLGAELTGKITKLAKSPDPGTPATMTLQFSQIVLPGEKPASISCHLAGIENAREAVLADGSIEGVKGTALPSSYLDTALSKLEQAVPSLGSTIKDIGNQQVGAPDTDISYPVGTDMQIKLDKAFESPKAYPPAASDVLSAGITDPLKALLADAPQRSETQKGTPGDPLNLVLIGDQNTIAQAFKKACWVVPAPKEKAAIWKTAQAMIKNLGYASAPISNLYLFNRPQDLAFEKMLNTFNERHHLRLWRSDAKTADGREIWLGAAMHDTGIDIHPGVVSHATSPNLDNERAKVGSDLLDTGMVAAEALVTRPNPLSQGFTGTGGAWHTDGRLLVIDLK